MTALKQNNFLKKIQDLSSEDTSELSNSIYNQLVKIHKNKNYEDNWLEEFTIDLNLSLYNHGLTKKHGLNDYILIDYLNLNNHLLKNRSKSLLIKNSSIIDGRLNDNLVEFQNSDKYGDWIIDYTDLNLIAYFNEDLANQIINKVLENNNSIKFYKLFTFYTAKYTIDLINERDKIKEKQDKEFYDEIINYIFDSYEDFTITKANWIKKI